MIDGTGKHVTPGLIDPHIHSGVSDVNETGATIVPEVYMGDVLTHNNIAMYRQLAGGLTTAMIKHGSANPIGGENVIVKMRWGSLPEDLKLEGATRTVKFALGENPKRCCYEGRYPRSRMGTQEIIRDHFLAARDYRREWQEWEKTKKGLPPRRDLRMDAILDILDQKLLISSHGYRADEFLALIRLAEEFGFKVMAIQHGVEAYKIAPELAKAGVAAAVWSDWGAFKMEAYDATKYNARILMEAGVIVSLHSDNEQIASRMNWEAGKLLRTGLTEEQAMTTVTPQRGQVAADPGPCRIARAGQGRRLRGVERRSAVAIHQGGADVGRRQALLLAGRRRGSPRTSRQGAPATDPGGPCRIGRPTRCGDGEELTMHANQQRAMTITKALRFSRLLAAVALGMAASQPLALSAQVDQAGRAAKPDRRAARGHDPHRDEGGHPERHDHLRCREDHGDRSQHRHPGRSEDCRRHRQAHLSGPDRCVLDGRHFRDRRGRHVERRERGR